MESQTPLCDCRAHYLVNRGSNDSVIYSAKAIIESNGNIVWELRGFVNNIPWYKTWSLARWLPKVFQKLCFFMSELCIPDPKSSFVCSQRAAMHSIGNDSTMLAKRSTEMTAPAAHIVATLAFLSRSLKSEKRAVARSNLAHLLATCCKLPVSDIKPHGREPYAVAACMTGCSAQVECVHIQKVNLSFRSLKPADVVDVICGFTAKTNCPTVRAWRCRVIK